MTKTFKLAHINEQGQNMIIFPLDSSFSSKTTAQQNQTCNTLEAAAHNAGLAGKAVLIWTQGRTTKFLAPPQWHAFFKSISYNQIVQSVNKNLTINA